MRLYQTLNKWTLAGVFGLLAISGVAKFTPGSNTWLRLLGIGRTSAVPVLLAVQPVTNTLTTNQPQRYCVEVPKASAFEVSLRPVEFRLRYTVYSPQGNPLRDGHTFPGQETHLLIVSDLPGKYVIEISQTSEASIAVHYEIGRTDLRPATLDDPVHISAELAVVKADELREGGTKEKRQAARDLYLEALDKWRKLGAKREEAVTLYALGVTYYYLGKETDSMACLQSALPLWQALSDVEGAIVTGLQLADNYNDLGHVPDAKKAYLELLRQGGNPSKPAVRADILTGLAITESKLGQLQQALVYYKQAREIYRQLAFQLGEVKSLSGLAYTYVKLGENNDAVDYYQQILRLNKQLASQLDRQRFQEAAHRNLGRCYLNLGRHQLALEHLQQALPLSRQLEPRLEALTLRALGQAYEALGDQVKALSYYESALPITQRANNPQEEVLLRNLLGNRYEANGDKPRALDQYQRALPICQQIKDPTGEVTTRHDLAHVLRDLNRLPEAQVEIKAAIDLIEGLREHIFTRSLQESYFATVQKSYGLYIDILMRQHNQQPNAGFAARAWQVNEQARARTLREMLNENRVDFRTGLPPALLERENRLQEELNTKANLLLGGGLVTATIESLAGEVRALRQQLAEVESEMRQAAPGYAALIQPQPLTVGEVQRKLLDDDQTALLEYAFAEESSYVWLITKQRMHAFALRKNRAEIGTLALRVRDLLTARLQPNGAGAYADRISQADAQYWQAAAQLSAALLPAELLAQLTQPRLLVVSDGALQSLPFSALPWPGDTEFTPLLTRFEITHLPSMSVLAELRRQPAASRARGKLLAVLADPVYNADDDRLRLSNGNLSNQSTEASPQSPAAPLSRLQADNTARQWRRLSHADQEAETLRKIAAHVAPAEQSLVLKGLEVTRALVEGPRLRDYQILHFATHGYLDSEHPELSGLVLSRVQANGTSSDGFLRLHEIYKLKLPAEMIVLSACETAAGKEVRGEGLIALTRGFMYAGATRVVASLWQVDDVATSELMGRFYQGMLEEGLRPAAALQQAQKAMWKDERTRAPYYWAPFILQGDPRKFSFRNTR